MTRLPWRFLMLLGNDGVFLMGGKKSLFCNGVWKVSVQAKRLATVVNGDYIIIKEEARP